MSFIISKLMWWLFSPGNLILLACLTGGLLFRLGLRRWGGWLLTLGIAGLAALALLPVSDWLLRPLENRFPRPELPARIDGVIVLGGAINGDLSRLRGQVVVNDSAERLLAMADLARRYPEAPVVFTSGTASIDGEGVREADLLADLLPVLGLEPGRVMIERNARNTYENALYAKEMLGPKPDGGAWVLVTSAYHMPRAVGIFRALDWPVIAYPVDYGTAPDGSGSSYAVMDGMSAAHWAIREWVGLLYYRVMGRTNTVFPGP